MIPGEQQQGRPIGSVTETGMVVVAPGVVASPRQAANEAEGQRLHTYGQSVKDWLVEQLRFAGRTSSAVYLEHVELPHPDDLAHG